jgi:hypothetical protein
LRLRCQQHHSLLNLNDGPRLADAMSNESEENAQFVTWPCQHCNGPIEFDANELTSELGAKVPCPHCGKQTWVFEPDSTRCSSVYRSKSPNRRVVISIVAALGGILLIGMIAFLSGPTHKPEDFFLTLFALIMMAVLAAGALAFYFLPTIIACKKKKVNTLAILALNLLLGWTLIGWIVALIWSLAKDNSL